MSKLLKLFLVVALILGVMVGIGRSEADAAPSVVEHASSTEAAQVCNATMPAGVSGDRVLHAHLTNVLLTYRDYTCESWNFVSGSGSHGAYWHAVFLFSCGCPFGPLNPVTY